MKGNLSLLLDDNLIRVSLYLSLILLSLQLVLILFLYSKLPPLIPLLNSQPWGTTRLYPAVSIFLIPIFLVTVFVTNNFLSAILYKKNSLIARMLSFNGLLFIFLSLLAFVQIILLVF